MIYTLDEYHVTTTATCEDKKNVIYYFFKFSAISTGDEIIYHANAHQIFFHVVVIWVIGGD